MIIFTHIVQKSEYKNCMLLLNLCSFFRRGGGGGGGFIYLSIVSYIYILLGGWGRVRWLNLVGNDMSFCSHTCIYFVYANLEINK